MTVNKYQVRSNTNSLYCFTNMVRNVSNSKILVSLTCPSRWKLSMSLKGYQVSKVSFSHSKLSCLFTILFTWFLFPFSVPEEEGKKGIWMKLIQDYHDAMKILWKWNEYTAEDVRLFQVKINNFSFSLHWRFRCRKRRCDKLHSHAWIGTYYLLHENS